MGLDKRVTKVLNSAAVKSMCFNALGINFNAAGYKKVIDAIANGKITVGRDASVEKSTADYHTTQNKLRFSSKGGQPFGPISDDLIVHECTMPYLTLKRKKRQ